MSFGRGGGGGYGGRGGDGASTMLVEASNVGKIIGRGGSKIRELEQDSNARIKIAREEDADGMKSIEILGAPEDIETARRLIEDCLNASDFGGGGQRRGYGGGRGGDNWGRRDRDGGDGYRRRNDYNDRGFSGGNRMGGGGGRGGFGGEGGDSETVYVESSEVGRIIGRGGSKIRDMEADSGCRIKVSRDGDSYGRSSVELMGTKGSISEAKRLIQEAGVELTNGNDSNRGW